MNVTFCNGIDHCVYAFILMEESPLNYASCDMLQ